MNIAVDVTPVPTTALEARVVDVTQALDLGFIGPGMGFDWAHVYQAAVKGQAYNVCATSNFFRELLWSYPEVYQKLKPYLNLPKASEKRLRAHHEELKAGKAK